MHLCVPVLYVWYFWEHMHVYVCLSVHAHACARMHLCSPILASFMQSRKHLMRQWRTWYGHFWTKAIKGHACFSLNRFWFCRNCFCSSIRCCFHSCRLSPFLNLWLVNVLKAIHVFYFELSVNCPLASLGACLFEFFPFFHFMFLLLLRDRRNAR